MPQRVSKIQSIGNRFGKPFWQTFAAIILLAIPCTPANAGESISAPFAYLETVGRTGEGPVDDRTLATICGKGTQGDIVTKVSTSVVLWDEAGGGGTRRRDVYQEAEVSVTAQTISFTLKNN